MHDEGTAAQAPIEFDPETDTYRAEYADVSEPPSAVIPRAVAEISGDKPCDLDPLYEVVDPDALDSLFLPTWNGTHRPDGEVAFDYGGHRVTVRSYGIIEIWPVERAG